MSTNTNMTANTPSLSDMLFDAVQDAAEQLIFAGQRNETPQEIERLRLVLSINMDAFQQAMREESPWSEDGWHLPVGVTPDMLDNPGVDPAARPVDPATIIRSTATGCRA